MPKVLRIFDEKPKVMRVFDEKPKMTNMLSETNRLYERTLGAGMYMGIPPFTYPTTIIVLDPTQI